MFNLEQSITEWRRQMLAAGINKPALVDELEGHLREEIERLTKSGLTPADAFGTAVEQIGKAILLKKEFKKISGVSIWLEWLMIAIAAVFVGFIVFLGGAAVWMCDDMSVSDRVIAALAMACTVVVACCWRYAVPFLPAFSGGVKRSAIGLGCIACGFAIAIFYADVILPHFAPDRNGHAPAAVFWAAFIIAVFSCLGIGLSLSEKDREIMGMKKSV